MTPHSGFTSRADEIVALTQIIGQRSFGVSEFGYHTARRHLFGWSWFPYTFRWSDDQVAEYVAVEFRFWREHGAVAACLYQYLDGLTDAPADRFGIRRVLADGTPAAWKPVADVFAGVL